MLSLLTRGSLNEETGLLLTVAMTPKPVLSPRHHKGLVDVAGERKQGVDNLDVCRPA